MRLRLRIERNALPPTQALWPVKEGKCTIAQLLAHVNNVFPLESDTWGLEDYDVSVGGYECLHWHEVQSVCKEDDELVIKPLQYVDVRARTLAGRAQISADGRHLVDGVPFGRPCLKSPVRPQIDIPARKRQRLLKSDVQEELLRVTENVEELSKAEEEEDEDFGAEESEASSPSDSSSSEVESEDSDESEDETSSSESESEDSTDSDSDSDSDSETWKGIANSDPNKSSTKTMANQANSIPPNHRQSSLAGTKRKRQVDDDHETEDDHKAEEPNVTGSLPFQGNVLTKVRNARRRDSRKLKHLKKMQAIPQDADLKTLREWQKHNGGTAQRPSGGAGVAVSEADEDLTMTDDKAQETPIHQSEASLDVVAKTHGLKPHSQPQKLSSVDARVGVQPVALERQQLLTAISLGGIDVTNTRTSTKPARSRKSLHRTKKVDGEPSDESSSNQQDAVNATANLVRDDVVTEDRSQATGPASASRRTQLDMAASKRLLFSGLGVKVPKTQEEREKVQKKLADRPKRNVSSMEQTSLAPHAARMDHTKAAITVVEAEEDADSWMEKINLTAVECCDEGVTMSTPPFPFQQRWDPQYQRKKKGRTSGAYMSGGGKKNRDSQNQVHVETYDKYNTDGNGDYLDYGDASGGEQDEFWEEGALLGGNYDVDGEQEGNEGKDDGFPPLPTNLEELPRLQEDEARVGDFVAFAELACDESTAWQPKAVTRTAKILEASVADNVSKIWTLQLSGRDLKSKNFDEEGKRVYGKFEMPDQEDDDNDDEGTRVVSWAELGPVKLVRRAGEETNNAG